MREAMTAIEYLDKAAPRQEKLRLLSRDQSAIFAHAVELFQRHYDDEPRRDAKPNLALLHTMLKRLSFYEAAAFGYERLANFSLDDEGQRLEFARKAEKYACLALIYAYGARKVNCGEDETCFDQQTARFAEAVVNRITTQIENDAARSVQQNLAKAEQRGWKTPLRGATLITVMGANWCPDTATVVEIANAFELPINLWFNEYLQPEEEKGRRKHGILKSHDHATAVYEDHLGKPRMPVIYYPNGTVHSEPAIPLVIEQLMLNDMI